MTDDHHSAGPAPMEGHGSYNRSSAVQAAGLAPALALLEQAAGAVCLPHPPGMILIADYGSSEGRNSLTPMRLAIDRLRQRAGRERAISVVHTDLPGSDFSQLFQTLEADPNSYLQNGAPIYASAVGRSFYGQVLPSESVTLGWSSWAVQWLSRTPALIPDHITFAYSKDPVARTAYTSQAAEDWRAFLGCRARELHQGGHLIVMTPATDEKGDGGYRRMLETIRHSIACLVDEKFLSPEEARRMALPIVGRSRAEFIEPFAQDGKFAGLAIEHFEFYYGKDTIWETYQTDRNAGAFGAAWAGFARAAAFPTLALGLHGGRNDPRAPIFLTRMEEATAAALAAHPEPTTIPLARLVFRKETC
jgi:hypothetical protein